MGQLPCNTNAIQFSGEPSTWYNVNVITGKSTVNGTLIPTDLVNAIGFNPYDNLIYGYDQTTNQVVKIDSTRTITSLNIPIGQIPIATYQVGCVSTDGYYYLYFAKDTKYYTVDVKPLSPNYGKLVDPKNGFTIAKSPYGTPITLGVDILDWAYNKKDKLLYGIESGTGHVITLNPLTAQTVKKTLSLILPGSYGSVFIDGDGVLYTISSDGVIYRYNIDNLVVTRDKFTDTDKVNKNDATICPTAKIIIDFGDAPDNSEAPRPGSYRSKLASNGPRHGVITNLMLGKTITSEIDSNDNVNATGDDILKDIQDDGVVIDDLIASKSTYTLTVDVTNSTGSIANLYGWIDFNENGSFDINEFSSETIISSTINPQVVNLIFNVPSGLKPGKTFARVRLTTDNLEQTGLGNEDTRSYGPASDGEVEDYEVTIKAESPICNGPIAQSILVGTSGAGVAQAIDPQGYTLTYSLKPSFGPSYNTVSVDETTGDWIYNSISGYVGIDSFIITATAADSGLSCDTLVTINIVEIKLDSVISADKRYVKKGDQLTYTLVITNNSSIGLIDGFVKDILSLGETLVLNTTYINGVLIADADITEGISFRPMAASEVKTIKFTVDVAEDLVNSLSNVANTTAEVLITAGTVTKNGISNTVKTPIIEFNLDLIADKTQVLQGDTLEYIITYKNTADVTIRSAIIKDNIPKLTTLVPGTTTVNGVLKLEANIVTGVEIGPLAAGDTATVSFKVRIDDNAQVSSKIKNEAKLDFILEINNETIKDNILSNTIESEVLESKAILSIVKSAMPKQVLALDSVKYTLKISNTGSLDANNVILTDILSLDLENAYNLTVNGVSNSGNIESGINIGTVKSNSTSVVTFKAKVKSIPIDKKINNTTTSKFNYTMPSGTVINGNIKSNVETIEIYNVDVTMTKTSNKNVVKIGDVFIYTIIVKNTGNVDIEEYILTGMLPPQLKAQEITVDGEVVYEEVVAKDLNTGLNLGKITIGKVVIVKIKTLALSKFNFIEPYKNVSIGTIKYSINGVKSSKDINAIDDVGVLVVQPKLRLEKSTNTDIAIVGDIITYKITATNEGSVDFDKVVVKDLLAPSLDFVEGSSKIEGDSLLLANILAGVDIGALAILEKKTLEFKATVVGEGNKVCNIASADYYYTIGNEGIVEYGFKKSNQNCIDVEKLSLVVNNVADKNSVGLNEIITYISTIKNEGDSIVNSVIFKDELEASLELVENSVTVNGALVVNPNLTLGINIGQIKPGEVVTINYKAKAIGGTGSCQIINKAYAEYKYALSNGSVRIKTSNIASVAICSKISAFKQLSIDKLCVVPCEKPNIEEVNNVEANAKIVSSYVIKTYEGISNEGQNLSGHKLVVNGVINVSVEYTADVESQSIHAYSCHIPFGTFIILPSNYDIDKRANVDIVIEDIGYEEVNGREIVVNIMYLVIAKVS